MNNNYLQSGPLTTAGKNIERILSGIKGTGVASIFEILNFLMKSEYRELSPDELSKIHMKRSAEEIIEDGFFTSCRDYGIVFCTLSRAKNIPTKFMHFLDMNQFRIKPENLSLHVFCECLFEEFTLFIDPQKGLVQNILNTSDYRHLLKRNGKDYVLGYEGLDNKEFKIFSERELLLHMANVGKNILKNC
jgi:hypothetical protein